MISEVTISNFKSVRNLTLPLGRVNIFIGANGSGKSNILEAIAFAGAASADKLDNEFLKSRGIRISNAELMKSAFDTTGKKNPVEFGFKSDEREIKFTIESEVGTIPKWNIQEKGEIENSIVSFIDGLFLRGELNLQDNINTSQPEDLKKIAESLTSLFEQVKSTDNDITHSSFINTIKETLVPSLTTRAYKEILYDKWLSEFIIYSPELSALRKYEEEGQIFPLGINGEGLFHVLQIFHEKYEPETIQQIKDYLHLIEWFDDFESVDEKSTNRKYLVVKDRFMPDIYLNQSNVNEGFLYLLFYVSLILSKETPAFFAIDNIEASFHPVLCKELIRKLTDLAHTQNKQILITTHNPFILDGLNLDNQDERLFVVKRNSEGETIAKRITKYSKNIKLSEAWMSGYIGGNPETI